MFPSNYVERVSEGVNASTESLENSSCSNDATTDEQFTVQNDATFDEQSTLNLAFIFFDDSEASMSSTVGGVGGVSQELTEMAVNASTESLENNSFSEPGGQDDNSKLNYKTKKVVGNIFSGKQIELKTKENFSNRRSALLVEHSEQQNERYTQRKIADRRPGTSEPIMKSYNSHCLIRFKFFSRV